MAEEIFFRGNNKAMMQKSRTWDKEVGCSCLVFKREKAVSFCGARSLSADKVLTESLTATGCTAIAYETLEVGGRLPLLEPMSELAGRMAAIFGSYHLANHRGGRGILLGGVPGVAPGRVMVIGGGTAGVNAARVATGIGADVGKRSLLLDLYRSISEVSRCSNRYYCHLLLGCRCADSLSGRVAY